MMMDEAPLIIAIDGGGSTCRVRLVSVAGEVLGTATGGASNLTSDFEGARAVIADAVATAYRGAGHSPERMSRDVACFALAGTEGGFDLDALNPGFARLSVISDLDATVEAALGGADAVLASLGTGSFFVVQQGGRVRRAGGWGFHLSDDCSGAALGREVLRRAVAVQDGLADGSPFIDSIWHEFGDIRAMIAFAKAATPQDYARYARSLVHAGEDGDPVAVEILGAAAQELAALLVRLGARDIGRICLTGGLGPVYARLLPAGLASIALPPDGSPLDAAEAHARALLGRRAGS